MKTRSHRRVLDARLLLLPFTSLCSSACGPEHVFVPWSPPPAGEFVHLLHMRGAEISSSRGPLEPDDASFGVYRELEVEGTSLLFVTLRRAEILDRLPAVDPEDFSRLWFETRATGCAGVLRRQSERLLPLDPQIARVQRWTGSALEDVPPSEVSVLVGLPIDERACVGRQVPRFVSYLEAPIAPDLERFNPEANYPFRSATSVGRGRLVATRGDAVFVFDRGTDGALDPSRRWSAAEWPRRSPSFSGWGISAAALDHVRSSETQIRLLLVLEAVDAARGVEASDVVELTWTPRGFGTPRGWARVDARLNDVAILDDGRAIALGEEGNFLVQSSTATDFGLLEGVDFARADLEVLGRGPSEREPVVLVDGGHGFYFGALEAFGTFRVEPNPITLGGAKHLIRIDGAGGLYYYSDTDSPELLQRAPDGTRSRFEIELPTSLAACGSEADECGVRRLAGHRLAVAPTPSGNLLIIPTDCAAILEVEPRRGCVRLIEHEGPAWSEMSGRVRPSLSVGPSGVTLLDDRGLLLEAQFEP